LGLINCFNPLVLLTYQQPKHNNTYYDTIRINNKRKGNAQTTIKLLLWVKVQITLMERRKSTEEAKVFHEHLLTYAFTTVGIKHYHFRKPTYSTHDPNSYQHPSLPLSTRPRGTLQLPFIALGSYCCSQISILSSRDSLDTHCR
jgi:hypothetical protein